MPVGFDHDPNYIFDIGIGNFGLKEIAHAIDKNCTRPGPLERLRQFRRHQAEIKSLFVGVALNSAKSLSESLGVAVFAAGANLGATAERIPSSVRPFDFGVIAHRLVRVLRLLILSRVASRSRE
jgi:hypothetical protein